MTYASEYQRLYEQLAAKNRAEIEAPLLAALAEREAQIAVLRGALNAAAETISQLETEGDLVTEVMPVLMNAIAAPQPTSYLMQYLGEPVAWCQDIENEVTPEFGFSWVKTRLHDFPLYALPRKEE